LPFRYNTAPLAQDFKPNFRPELEPARATHRARFAVHTPKSPITQAPILFYAFSRRISTTPRTSQPLAWLNGKSAAIHRPTEADFPAVALSWWFYIVNAARVNRDSVGQFNRPPLFQRILGEPGRPNRSPGGLFV